MGLFYAAMKIATVTQAFVVLCFASYGRGLQKTPPRRDQWTDLRGLIPTMNTPLQPDRDSVFHDLVRTPTALLNSDTILFHHLTEAHFYQNDFYPSNDAIVAFGHSARSLKTKTHLHIHAQIS